MKSDTLRFRQVHLDFHTGPRIPDVGSKFDAGEFAETVSRARANSVTVFAKCHHGHLYFSTSHPARHPSLPRNLDLLGEQVEALHARGINAPIYISVQCDEFAANTHPEWIALTPELKHVKGGASAFEPGWQILDMSSPYQDYLADQIAEVLRKFKPVDGIFLDMCWDQSSCSKWAFDGVKKAGLNPRNEEDRKKHARQVSFAYMARYKQMIEQAHRGRPVRVAFNSRPLANLGEEKKFLHHVEIEALPTGGWGYMYFPLNVRFVRTFGLPYLGMTARFHKSWADFGGIKPEAALMYECCQMLAHGARCSIGDQMHPRGTLDKTAYRLIGDVYARVEACEPWCEGAEPVTDIGVLFGVAGNYHLKPGDSAEGAVRSLQQLRHQFDFVAPSAAFDKYRVIIVPENTVVDPTLKSKLRDYLRKGGAVLICGNAARDANGKAVLKEMGIEIAGTSPFTTTYFRFSDAPHTDHVMYEAGLRILPRGNARALARVVEPYFERAWNHFSSHRQTPPAELTAYAAAVRNGRVATIAYPIFGAYATHGNLPYRQLIDRVIAELLPDPILRADGPIHIESTVTRRKNRLVLHLLNFCPQRRAQSLDIVEDVTPVHNLRVSVRSDGNFNRVTLVPQNKRIPFEKRNGRINFSVPRLDDHQMFEISQANDSDAELCAVATLRENRTRIVSHGAAKTRRFEGE